MTDINIDPYELIYDATQAAAESDPLLLFFDFESAQTTKDDSISALTVDSFTKLLNAQMSARLLMIEKDQLQHQFTKGLQFLQSDAKVIQKMVTYIQTNSTQICNEIASHIKQHSKPTQELIAKVHIYADSYHLCKHNLYQNQIKQAILELNAAKLYCIKGGTAQLINAIQLYKKLFISNAYQHAEIMTLIQKHDQEFFLLVCKNF